MDLRLRPLEHRREISEPLFALTFDDGPSAWTGAVLEQLRAHGAAATFFVIGCRLGTAEHDRTLRQALAGANEVGNHTFTHLPLADLTPDDVVDELARTNRAIEQTAGITPRFWRPPYLRTSPGASRAAAALGLREVHASIVPADWEWDASRTAAYVLDRLCPGDVVDLHDGRPPLEADDSSAADRLQTVAALGTILAEATARGLRAVTVSELVDAR